MKLASIYHPRYVHIGIECMRLKGIGNKLF